MYSIETGEHEIRKTMGQHNTSALYDAVRLKYVFIFSFFNKTHVINWRSVQYQSFVLRFLGSKPRQFVELNTKD